MRDDARGRRRAKVSITVDPVLLNTVDQEAEMIEQFTGPDQVDEIEMRDWRHIRRAAASRKLKRPGR